jgi:hypothetical protein
MFRGTLRYYLERVLLANGERGHYRLEGARLIDGEYLRLERRGLPIVEEEARLRRVIRVRFDLEAVAANDEEVADGGGFVKLAWEPEGLYIIRIKKCAILRISRLP